MFHHIQIAKPKHSKGPGGPATETIRRVFRTRSTVFQLLALRGLFWKSLKNYAQNTQINAYPVSTAASVNGNPIFMKSPNDTS